MPGNIIKIEEWISKKRDSHVRRSNNTTSPTKTSKKLKDRPFGWQDYVPAAQRTFDNIENIEIREL